MKTIGWVRLGDKASCGGVVAEASSTETSHGKGYAFQGAAMDCKKGCKIADGHPNARLTNGKQRVTHGQCTSGGCALASTLNDVDGIGNASGSQIADAFKQDAAGNLLEIFLPRPLPLCTFDQHVVFVDEHGAELDGVPYQLADERGATIDGVTGSDGRTNIMGSEKAGNLTISLGAGETA
jgi:uncharacterized Zn-binding protein involved in type VI secretion